METAFRDGINTIIEFGGGLGSGPAPEDKRPNLESMVKKALRGSDFSAHYHAAINSQTLQETASNFNAHYHAAINSQTLQETAEALRP